MEWVYLRGLEAGEDWYTEFIVATGAHGTE